MEPNKGKIFKGDIIQTEDKITGVKVKRLSNDTGNTYHPYFYHKLLDADNKNLLVGSDRTGSHQIYLLNLQTGDMTQLTDMKESKDPLPWMVMDSYNNLVYFYDNNQFKRLRLDNLIEEELFELPEGFKFTGLSITNKGDYVAVSYQEK